MKHKILLLTLFISLFLNAKPSVKNSDNFFTIGYKAGTLGLGVDVSYAFNSTFALRGSFNTFSAFKNIKYEDKYFNTFGLIHNNGLLLDVHPWQNAFFFSWGAFNSNSKIDLKYKPKSKAIIVGDHTYPAMQIGDVKTSIKLRRKINPYFGFGLNSMDKNNRWHFLLDVGAIYTDTPKATIHAVASKGFEALQPVLDNESKIENKKLNQKIKKFKFYPVISVGVGYKF